MSAPRFTTLAAHALRVAIREAGGVEVYAVGEVGAGKEVVRIDVHARGTEDAVVALRNRPRAGQVVIHNHPSGVLLPSEPDMSLAHAFGEDGVGFVIVDNAVERANWVVEPHAPRAEPVDPDAVRAVFEDELPRLFPGWEQRPGQLDLALSVAASLHEGGVVVLEAGTGTGKSLGYLVPAALWALANDSKVAVSTYTRALQAQLVADDLPVVARVLAGRPFRYAVLKGRGNYLCRRKLDLALLDALGEDPAEPEGVEQVRRLGEWAAATPTGDRAELGWSVDDEVWDRVQSDADQTLRVRCPHYNTCFYYGARRAASAAHVVVVNHALLLRDLAIKGETQGVGILPRFDRVVLDEAHHLEEAATSAGAARVSALSITRAVAPLLPRPKQEGALARLGRLRPQLVAQLGPAVDALTLVRDTARIGFEQLHEGRTHAERVVGEPPFPELFADLGEELERVAARLGAIEAAFDEAPLPVDQAQPLLDLGRARRRLADAASVATGFLTEADGWCRFLDPAARSIAAARAPIDVGPFLRRSLADAMETVVLTSATLAVGGRIEHYLSRTGLGGASFTAFPSPFDYERQVLLGLPRDLPAPDDPAFLDAAGEAIGAALRASRGGAFVLCTSYAMVRGLSERVGAALGGAHAILVHGQGSRERLLARFRADPGAILFGTDSFWEGVSVSGQGLRLVVIPKLPFRVPTEPVAQARYEALQHRGVDPFRGYALPEAVLRLRQGFGRLVRTKSDRGAVLVLDRRLHEASYGRVFLASLPPARRVVGPWRRVQGELDAFFTLLRREAGEGRGGDGRLGDGGGGTDGEHRP